MFNLVSFADSRMSPTLDRLRNQAARFEEIEKTFLFTEGDLSPEFRERAGDRLSPKVRGFGYWVWKPEVVLMAMKKIPEGDILCYCDAGFHLNFKGAEHLKRYVAPIQIHEVDLVAFSHDAQLTTFADQPSELSKITECWYTKGDMLDFWGARGKPSLVDTPQYASGLFFMRKSKENVKLLTQWRETALTQKHLFDDSQSTSPNFPGFIENRHDQSYFSLMCKGVDHCAFSAFEFWYPRGPKLVADWEIIAGYPFHAKRDKQFSGHRRFWQPIFRKYLAIRKKLRSFLD